MKEFNFHRASSVEDAVASLKKAESGKYLSGGQSLLPVLKLEMAAPNCLRSEVYFTAWSSAPCASPTICAPMPMRPSCSVSIAVL